MNLSDLVQRNYFLAYSASIRSCFSYVNTLHLLHSYDDNDIVGSWWIAPAQLKAFFDGKVIT